MWAANGSNEVMVQLLQAFGGPGRTAMAFTPTYSMYPEYARDTHTAWVTGARADDFTLTAADAAAKVRDRRPDVVFLASPNNPTGTPTPREDMVELIETGVPIVADIHFDYRIALAALDAGIAKLRLNPGNIGSPERVEKVVAKAKAAGILGISRETLYQKLKQYGKNGWIRSLVTCPLVVYREGRQVGEAEVAYRDDHHPGWIGDMPHTWVGAEYIRAVRTKLVYERESDHALVPLMRLLHDELGVCDGAACGWQSRG